MERKKKLNGSFQIGFDTNFGLNNGRDLIILSFIGTQNTADAKMFVNRKRNHLARSSIILLDITADVIT